jgi:hypothetical protein
MVKGFTHTEHAHSQNTGCADLSGIIAVSLFVVAPSNGASSRNTNSRIGDRRGKRLILPPTLATQDEEKLAHSVFEEGSMRCCSYNVGEADGINRRFGKNVEYGQKATLFWV